MTPFLYRTLQAVFLLATILVGYWLPSVTGMSMLAAAAMGVLVAIWVISGCFVLGFRNHIYHREES